MFPRHMHAMGEAPIQPEAPQAEYTEESFKVVYQVTLAQGASFDDLRKAIDGDGDMVVLDVYGTSTGPYNVQFRNAGHRPLSSSLMQNVNGVGTAQFPLPFGSVKYPAGGEISLAITNTHSAENKVEIIFSGIKIRKAGR